MKAYFVNDNEKGDVIYIVPETEKEAKGLKRWDNSVISSEYKPPYGNYSPRGRLEICREI